MSTTLIRVTTSQVDFYDLQSGRIRQLRDRQFVNNCVLVPWDEDSVLITGFDSPIGETMLIYMKSVRMDRLRKMLQGRKFHSGVKFRGKAYVMGGYTLESLKLRSCESFDGRSWSPEPQMTECRSSFSTVSTNTAIYAFGDTTSRSLEKFDGLQWRLLPFSLLFDTQNLAMLPLKTEEVLVIGGGSAATGASDAVRVQDLDSPSCTLLEKLPIPDYFKTPPITYQGSLFLIGMKGVYERREDGWRAYCNNTFCKLCQRWRCDGGCKWIRVRVVAWAYFRTKTLRMI